MSCSDEDGDELTYLVTSGPLHGSIETDGENIVYTIDDQLASKFYSDYLNIDPSDVLSISADYPMEVLLKNALS